MEANKVIASHKPPSDGGMAKEVFIRVGTTLYKIVEQPRLNGGYVKKRIPWNNETLRQDYGKDYIGSVPKYDGFCTVPEHIGYRPVIGKFLTSMSRYTTNRKRVIFPLSVHWWSISSVSNMSWEWTICNCSTCNPFRSYQSCYWYQRNAIQARVHFLIF